MIPSFSFCIRLASVSAVLAATSGAFAQPAPAFSAEPTTHDPAPAAERQDPARERFVFVPRLGLGLGGGGEREESEDCSSGYVGCDSTESDSFEDSSRIAFGADALFGVANGLRLGLGTLYVPSRTADDGDIQVGSDLSAFGVVEGVIPASPSLSIALRGHLGGVLVFPGGDLEDDIESERQDCQSARASGYVVSCEVAEGPFPGIAYGLGAGVIAPLEQVSLRMDLAYHAYSISRLREREDLGAAGSKEENEKLTGHQVWLLAGIEL